MCRNYNDLLQGRLCDFVCQSGFIFLRKGGIEMLLRDNVDSLNNPAIGQRIRDARVQKGYKSIDMAAALEISKDQYSRIENGRSTCSTQKLFQIAQYLDVTTDYLLFGDKQQGILSQITVLLGGKGDKELAMVKRVIEAMYL